MEDQKVVLIKLWFTVNGERGRSTRHDTSWDFGEVSLGPGPLLQAIQGSHRQKEPKTCHQRAVTKTHRNQTHRKWDRLFKKSRQVQQSKQGSITCRERWAVCRAKAKKEKVDKLGSREEIGNALHLPLNLTKTKKKIYPLNITSRRDIYCNVKF